jgi:POT family proton-dependent oligopeptide transporter
MVPGFAMVSFLQSWIDSGQTPSISWQLLAYVLLTASEVMVSITCLEFAYTQAPTSMKSVVMAMFLASVSLGNYFTAAVNKFILIEKGDSALMTETVRQDLGNAESAVRNYFEMHQEQLPRTEEGQALVGEMLDPWGSPLHYRMINRNSFRIVSLGNDQQRLTPDDLMVEVIVSRPSTDQGNDAPLNWRERRMVALLGDQGREQVQRERGGVPTIEFTAEESVGGAVKLEGAAYFWFWTWTMLVTAILFVFVAYFYVPRTYMQEESRSSEAQADLH